MTIPLTSKTLLTHRIIRGLTYFFFRFFSIIHLSGFIPPKISKFSIVFTFCPSVVIPKKVSKVLGKICSLCSKEFIIKSIPIKMRWDHKRVTVFHENRGQGLTLRSKDLNTRARFDTTCTFLDPLNTN